MRHRGLSLILIIALLFFLAACGGGGGGGGEQSIAPVISNLQYSPQSVEAGSGSVNVTGRIDFKTDIDIATLMLSDSRGGEYSVQISGSAGIKSGYINVPENSLLTDPAGLYIFNVWLIDASGKNSNKLTGTIDVDLIADAGISQVVTTGGGIYLDGIGSSDVNGLFYYWKFINKPENSFAIFDDETTVNPMFVPDVDGVYEIQLIVNDGVNYSDPDTLFITAIPTDYVSIGSYKDDVMAVQGTPSEIDTLFNRWYYSSLTYFTFSGDTVTAWKNYDGSLKVIMVPGINTTGATYITLGSHKDDVIAIQGTPSEIDTLFNRWYYSSLTYFTFSGDTVTAWKNYDGSLIVQ